MGDSGRGGYLQLSREAQAALIDAARDAQPVRGLTHGYYKYPARFSPVFARAAIETFSKPGDLVLDPHVGGGTTLVEARASGREAVGVDISSLAEFVSNVKCTVYSDAELHTLAGWSRRVANSIDIHKPSRSFAEYEAQGYYKHLGHPSRWRFMGRLRTRCRDRAFHDEVEWAVCAVGDLDLRFYDRALGQLLVHRERERQPAVKEVQSRLNQAVIFAGSPVL
jgi:hypothetical protein